MDLRGGGVLGGSTVRGDAHRWSFDGRSHDTLTVLGFVCRGGGVSAMGPSLRLFLPQVQIKDDILRHTPLRRLPPPPAITATITSPTGAGKTPQQRQGHPTRNDTSTTVISATSTVMSILHGGTIYYIQERLVWRHC